MILSAKSIPYSIKIAGEWCRIIHNNQQLVCNECQEVGHTRKRHPQFECRICKDKGLRHLSYVCNANVLPENLVENTETPVILCTELEPPTLQDPRTDAIAPDDRVIDPPVSESPE